MSADRTAEARRLLHELENALFDCGSWRQDDDEPYSAVSQRADEARRAYLAHIGMPEEATASQSAEPTIVVVVSGGVVHSVQSDQPFAGRVVVLDFDRDDEPDADTLAWLKFNRNSLTGLAGADLDAIDPDTEEGSGQVAELFSGCDVDSARYPHVLF